MKAPIKEYERDIQQLFKRWSQKQEDATNGTHLDRKWFVVDGIVSLEDWAELPWEKRIVFLLKEVNDPKCNHNWAIRKLLDKDYKYRMWRRLAEWTRGILLAEPSKPVPAFEEFPDGASSNEWLKKIAVVNLKKSPGGGSADMDAILRHAQQDQDEILEELRLIDPGVIICGGTGDIFSEILPLSSDSIRLSSAALEYRYATIFDKERLIIDFWHPANRFPMKLNYYAITCIYQHAVQAKEQMR